jgi:hypothetical protein
VGMVDGHMAFGVNYRGVGYFSYGTDKLNSFQVVIIDRSDTGRGNFDIEFNYDRIQWETGNASGGTGGKGGESARVGFANGNRTPGTFYEAPGSGVPGAFVDGGPNAQAEICVNSTVRGRAVFAVRGGVVQMPNGGCGWSHAAHPTTNKPNGPALPGENSPVRPVITEESAPLGKSAPTSSGPVSAVPVAASKAPVFDRGSGGGAPVGSGASQSDQQSAASQAATALVFSLGQGLPWAGGGNDGDSAAQQEALLLALGDTTVPIVYTLDCGDLPPDPQPPARVNDAPAALPEALAMAAAAAAAAAPDSAALADSPTLTASRCWTMVAAVLAGLSGVYVWERTSSRRRSKVLNERIFGDAQPAPTTDATHAHRETHDIRFDETLNSLKDEIVVDWFEETPEMADAESRWEDECLVDIC